MHLQLLVPVIPAFAGMTSASNSNTDPSFRWMTGKENSLQTPTNFALPAC